jgi:hypothetical protein
VSGVRFSVCARKPSRRSACWLEASLEWIAHISEYADDHAGIEVAFAAWCALCARAADAINSPEVDDHTWRRPAPAETRTD